MSKTLIKVPIDKKGNQHTWYYDRAVETGEILLKDNFTFESKLFYDGFSRGRSALNIQWVDSKGHTYQSGMSLLDSALQGGLGLTTGIENAVFFISGKFTFKKQGTSVLLTTVS